MISYLQFAKNLALKAGDIMLEHFDTDVSQREKADNTIVTIADEQINDLVIKEIAQIYPEHSVFGEEMSSTKNSNLTWLCDPIDGTLPYSKSLPVSVFSIALVDDGTPVVGVVYDPFTKRLYSAEIGKGAYMNDKNLTVSSTEMGKGTVLDVEWWPSAEFDIYRSLHTLSLDSKVNVLQLGSTVNACCKVAVGMYEACVFAGTKEKAVDIAAVKVIVEEAGGKVTDLSGNDQRYDGDIKGAIVSNGIIHEQLVKALSETL